MRLPSGITGKIEFHLRGEAGSPPETVEPRRADSLSNDLVPTKPHSRDTILPRFAGVLKDIVRIELGYGDRNSREPPRHPATGENKFLRAPPGPARATQADNEQQQKDEADNNVIQKMHDIGNAK